MSRTDNGKCPDIGQWCWVDRDLCDGNCMVKRIEDLEAENARLKAELNKDDCLKLANDVDRLREENARLKEALKPVMAYDYKQTCDLDDFMAACHCMNIINEAQRIYNGGVE